MLSVKGKNADYVYYRYVQDATDAAHIYAAYTQLGIKWLTFPTLENIELHTALNVLYHLVDPTVIKT